MLRPVLGQPAFTVVMITIGIGYVLRGLVTMVPGWGTDTYTFPTPFADGTFRIGEVIIAVQQVAVIVMTAALVAVLYVFFRYSKLGVKATEPAHPPPRELSANQRCLCEGVDCPAAARLPQWGTAPIRAIETVVAGHSGCARLHRADVR